MNNLLTYSHHLNNVISSVSVLSKQIKDLDEKVKSINNEKKSINTESLIKRIENIESLFNLMQRNCNEQTIKLLIKSEVEASIKNLLIPPPSYEDGVEENEDIDDIIIEEKKPPTRKATKRASKHPV